MRRGPLRRAVARRRRIRRRIRRRMLLGSTLVLAVGAAATRYKLSRSDAETIERQTGKNAEDLTEEELLAAMKKLGIQKLELTAEDEKAIEEAETEEVDE